MTKHLISNPDIGLAHYVYHYSNQENLEVVEIPIATEYVTPEKALLMLNDKGKIIMTREIVPNENGAITDMMVLRAMLAPSLIPGARLINTRTIWIPQNRKQNINATVISAHIDISAPMLKLLDQ